MKPEEMVILITFIICGLFIIRIMYISHLSTEINTIIGKYIKYLIDIDKYNPNTNYFKEIKIDFVKGIFCFWLIKPYDLIKPQYREELKICESFMK